MNNAINSASDGANVESGPLIAQEPSADQTISAVLQTFLKAAIEKWEEEDASPKKSFATRTLITAFALVAGSNYAGAAIEGAQRGYVPLDSITTAIITTIAASAVLVNTTEQSRLWYLLDKIPSQIQGYFPPKSSLMASWENWKVAILSFVASMPLTSTTAAYSKSLPLWLLIPLLLIVQAANSGMHTLPVYLVLKGPWIYRFPIVPFEFLYRQAEKFFVKPETNEDLIRNMQLKKVEELVSKLEVRLVERMTVAVEKSCLAFRLKGCDISLSQPLEEAFSDQHSLNSLMGQEDKALNNLSLNFLRGPFSKMTAAVGSFWLLSGALQFSWVVNDVFYDWFGSEAASATIAASSGYTFGVLVTFIGGFMMVDTINRALKAVSGENVLSTAVKFYSLFFLLMVVPIVFCSAFSYGATAVITEDYFKDDMPAGFYWTLFAGGCSSIVFLGLNSLSEFFVGLMSEYARHFGSPDEKKLIQFEQRIIPQLVKWLHLMDKKTLLNAIKNSSEDENQTYFGEKVEFKESLSKYKTFTIFAGEDDSTSETGVSTPEQDHQVPVQRSFF